MKRKRKQSARNKIKIERTWVIEETLYLYLVTRKMMNLVTFTETMLPTKVCYNN